MQGQGLLFIIDQLGAQLADYLQKEHQLIAAIQEKDRKISELQSQLETERGEKPVT